MFEFNTMMRLADAPKTNIGGASAHELAVQIYCAKYDKVLPSINWPLASDPRYMQIADVLEDICAVIRETVYNTYKHRIGEVKFYSYPAPSWQESTFVAYAKIEDAPGAVVFLEDVDMFICVSGDFAWADTCPVRECIFAELDKEITSVRKYEDENT